MIKIKIDLSSLKAEIGKKLDEVSQVALTALGTYASDRLREEAKASLSIDTHKKFVNSLQISQEKYKYIIMLADEDMSRLDTGYSSFDMKKGFLNSQKVKTSSSGGKYIDIPLPKKITKRGKGTYVSSRSMRTAIQNAMNQLGEGDSTRMFTGAKHKGTIHAAMIIRNSGGKLTASTIRRVSENSPDNSWIHKGIKGLKIFDKVAYEVENIKDDVIRDTARRMGYL